MLVTLVVLVLVGLGGAVDPWWNNALYYRVVVDSFRDSDGDGLGDLNGVKKQISYARAIGADAVILSPLSSRSPDCSKPGVVDFTHIDHRYGDMQALSELLEKAKKLGLKMLITLPLQTVSAASDWFTSSANKVNGFEDIILWQEGNPDEPPKSADGISWTFNEMRNAFYASNNMEPLLNLCSETVISALSAAQCAWLLRGFSGVLVEPDFPPDNVCGENLLKKLSGSALACGRSANLDTTIILVQNSLPPEAAVRHYTGGKVPHSLLNMALASPERSSAASLGIAIHTTLLTCPDDEMPTWITSPFNGSRIATRYGNEMVDAINLLALILPGAVIIQQGDELGSADTLPEWTTSNTCWPNKPNPAYTPMSWDDSPITGFSTAEPWVPISPNYRYANAKMEYAKEMSHQGVVKQMAAMRKSPAIGPHIEIKRLGSAIAILRWGGPGCLLVIANLGLEQIEVQVSQIAGLPYEMTVALSSAESSHSTGSHVTLDKNLKLAPGESLLLAGGPRHCGGPGPVDKIASKLSEGWQKINKYFNSM